MGRKVSKKLLISLTIGFFILILGGVVIFQSNVSEIIPNSLNNNQHVTTSVSIPIVPLVTGRPCRSNDEWHQTADQSGAWIDGILIDSKKSNSEILAILDTYNISTSKIRFLEPHYIGYYVEIPEIQYQQIRETIEGNQTMMNVSFSSPMYAFTDPPVKKQNNLVIVPVMISYSCQMNETETYQDLLNRGIPIRKSIVLEIDYEQKYSPSFREQLLIDLASDDRVLFTYKAYLEGILC